MAGQWRRNVRLWAAFLAFTALTSHYVQVGVATSRPGLRGDDDFAQSIPKEDIYKAMSDLIPKDAGYELSEYFVTTDDGYILRMFRLAYSGPYDHAELSCKQHSGSDEPTQDPQKPVIFLQHALLDSSADYVVQGPGKSLAFVLAKQGFDVWMSNIRGNRFSRNHTTLDPDVDAAFWQYSWDEHVALDLPAMIQFVLRSTGVDSLQYLGYSQGTTMGLAALSSRPGLAKVIKLAVLLAPVGFVGRITSLPFRAMSAMNAGAVFQKFGIREFGAHDPSLAAVTSRFCSYMPVPCIKWMELLCGANPNGNIAHELLPAIMEYLPSGTSVFNMVHWGQMVRNLETGPMGIRMYDFGIDCPTSITGHHLVLPELALRQFSSPGHIPRLRDRHNTCNQLEYGQMQPPAYNLSKITTPLALFTGGMDSLSDSQDVELLLEALPHGIVILRHHIPEYAHLDYALGMDTPEKLFPTLTAVMRKHASC